MAVESKYEPKDMVHCTVQSTGQNIVRNTDLKFDVYRSSATLGQQVLRFQSSPLVVINESNQIDYMQFISDILYRGLAYLWRHTEREHCEGLHAGCMGSWRQYFRYCRGTYSSHLPILSSKNAL